MQDDTKFLFVFLPGDVVVFSSQLLVNDTDWSAAGESDHRRLDVISGTTSDPAPIAQRESVWSLRRTVCVSCACVGEGGRGKVKWSDRLCAWLCVCVQYVCVHAVRTLYCSCWERSQTSIFWTLSKHLSAYLSICRMDSSPLMNTHILYILYEHMWSSSHTHCQMKSLLL